MIFKFSIFVNKWFDIMFYLDRLILQKMDHEVADVEPVVEQQIAGEAAVGSSVTERPDVEEPVNAEPPAAGKTQI